MGSRVAAMADVAVEISLEEQISHLELENKVLKDRLTNSGKILDKAQKVELTHVLALEGIILRQREQLRNQSDALWRRRDAIRKLNARYQAVIDNVSAAQRWVEAQKAQAREDAEWRQAKTNA